LRGVISFFCVRSIGAKAHRLFIPILNPRTNILLELVDDQIIINGVRKIDTVEVQEDEMKILL
jgi:hypothetical protein